MKIIAGIRSKHLRGFGFYLLCIAAMQSYIYLQIMETEFSDYFYFDPRIGIYAFLDVVNIEIMPLINQRDFVLVEWLTVFWLFILGICFMMGKAPITTYIVSELLMSAPSLLFVCLVIIINISPAHGFSIGELPLPLISIGLTTFLPLIFILRSVQRSHKQAINGSEKTTSE